MHTPLTLAEVTMPNCPICTTPSTRMREVYHMCDACGCWWQDPMPAKVFHGPEEPGVDAMPEYERQVNIDLAGHLFHNVMGAKKGPTLDVGAKIPVLAAALQTHGCAALAIDGNAMDTALALDRFGVAVQGIDFERWSWPPVWRGHFRLITMIHVFEHLLDPIAATRKLRKLVADDGRVFIRLPDHTVPGYERDLSAHHYTIHPYFHSLSSILEILAQIGDAFVVESFTTPGTGQRDIVLRPIV